MPNQLQQLINDPVNRQTYGDTTYITIPANNLPLLQPLIDVGAATGLSAITTPIVDLLQPALRELVELGHDRTKPYGRPTTAGLFPAIEPTKLVADLAAAVGEGVHAALSHVATRATSPTTSVVAKLSAPDVSAATSSSSQLRISPPPMANALRTTFAHNDNPAESALTSTHLAPVRGPTVTRSHTHRASGPSARSPLSGLN